MARQTYLIFSPTATFPFTSFTEVLQAIEPHRRTPENSEAIDMKLEQAKTYFVNMGWDEVCWSLLTPLMDDLDEIFKEVFKPKRNEIDTGLLIGMNDNYYKSRMGDYYGRVRKLLQDKIRNQTWQPSETKQRAIATGLLYKLEFVCRESNLHWPFLTKSAVIALADSLKRMHNAIKEVSTHRSVLQAL
jgi:hypothetical protein